MSRVRAVDAVTGELVWEYDPEVTTRATTRMRAGWEHNRGIALWGDKVYVATWAGRLNAIDRGDGRRGVEHAHCGPGFTVVDDWRS